MADLRVVRTRKMGRTGNRSALLYNFVLASGETPPTGQRRVLKECSLKDILPAGGAGGARQIEVLA